MGGGQKPEMSGNRGKTPKPQDQTIDTGFHELTRTEAGATAFPSESSTKPTRTFRPTEKGLEYTSTLKENAGRTAVKAFRDQLKAFFTFLTGTRETKKVNIELENLMAHFEKTKHLLDEWTRWSFAQDDPQAQVVLDLRESVTDSFEGARQAAREKLRILQDEEDAVSVKSLSSHASRRSYRSRTSTDSAASTKETLINVKAKRAALEQRIKYNDAIQEQQSKLNKLKLQQALSETIAEENVYEEAVLDESPREENLPCDKDDVMERFLKSQPVISTASHTTTTLGTQSYEAQETPNIRPLGLPDSNHRVLPKPTANSAGAGYLETLQMPASQRIQAAARDKPPPLDASTPAVSQPPVPTHTSATSTTLRHSPPVIDSFPRTTPFVSPSVRYEADAYTPAPRASASPSTADGLQIAEALAKVTQLQRLPQAKPDVFRGDESDTRFFIWETAFDALIDSAPITAQQKLYLLYQHLDGKARKTVEQLQYMVGAKPETAYHEARKRLKQRFGRSAIVATDFENKLANWPKIATNDAAGIREFSDFLQQVEIASNYLPNLKIFEYPSKIQAVVEKLPNWFFTKWSAKVQTLQQQQGYDAFPSLADLVKEVTFHAERMNIPQISRSATGNTSSTPHAPSRRRQTGSAITLLSKAAEHSKPNTLLHKGDKAKDTPLPASPENPAAQKQCQYHNTKSHTLNECKKFRELSSDERKDFFRKNKLCFKCGARGTHLAWNCSENSPSCGICQRRHLTALHCDMQDASSACTQVCGGEGPGQSCARIVPVKLTHQSQPGKEILTYAVLDDQSTDVFISDSLLDKLDVTAQEFDLKVNTIIGSNTIRTKKITGLYIQDVNGEYSQIRVPYAYSREYIPATHQDIATPHVVRQWKHLAEIADKIPDRQDLDIGMLIGRNVPAAFQPISVISGNEEEPWAEQYKFGWTVIGRVCKDKISDSGVTHAACVNRVTVERETLLEYDSPKQHHVAPPFASSVPSKDMTSPRQVREMMELDYSEVHHSRKIRGTEQVESMEDKRFRKILTNGLHKNENGNWEAPLPFKNDDVTLPNNKGHCLRRLLSLKRKLLGDEKVKADYLAFMQKNLERGHASRVPTSQLHTQPGKVWYLPHFNVYHPRKPDQIRVVFDCSAVFENESLNKHLLQGPDQLNSLIGVLTRFRKEEVAFTCDIEQMFHNFYVNPEHRDFLRFLWFENNDLSGPIVEYKMDVHLFGAASSPGVANFCLHQTAESNRATYGNPAADFLRKDFYVDDGLKSLPTVSQALKLIKDCQEMCAQDKLRLHKFASNKKEVLEALPKEDRAKDLKTLDLRHDSMPVQRSLGTYWCIESDTLGFRIELKDKPLTRRGILSTISSVYDPLGAVAPVILAGKQILRE